MKALIAMSGGVDSSVAAYLTKAQGYDCIGCTMKLYNGEEVRYRQPEEWATVTPLNGREVQIRFDRPRRAITPGQAAVLYDGDTVLGGGVILPRA